MFLEQLSPWQGLGYFANRLGTFNIFSTPIKIRAQSIHY